MKTTIYPTIYPTMSDPFDTDPNSPGNREWKSQFSQRTWNWTALLVAVLVGAGVLFFLGVALYAIFHGF